jgi:hypothetical protein
MRTWVASLDVLFSVLLLYLAKQLLSPKRVRRRLPPGPPGLPFIKNLFDWPKSKAWETFRAWGKQYGMFQSGCEASVHKPRVWI